MPPKKRNTRGSNVSCFGPSAELPDDGDMYTVRDVLAACQRLHELTPGVADLFIAGQIAEKVRQKWVQCNPELVLITELAVKNKIARDMKTARNIKAKKASKTGKFYIQTGQIV